MSSLLPPADVSQLSDGKAGISSGLLEEYKLLEQQARFVMTSYMQGLGLYLALVGFGIREVLESKDGLRTVALIGALTCGNILAVYGAGHFRRMAYHALNRQSELADRLGFQGPYPMLWGYKAGIASFILVQLGMIAAFFRILCLHWR